MNKNLFFVFFISMALAACGGGDDGDSGACSDDPCLNGGTCVTDGSNVSANAPMALRAICVRQQPAAIPTPVSVRP